MVPYHPITCKHFVFRSSIAISISKIHLRENHSNGSEADRIHIFCHGKNVSCVRLCAMVHSHLFHLFYNRLGKCGFWIAIPDVVRLTEYFQFDYWISFGVDPTDWEFDVRKHVFLSCVLKVTIRLAKSVWIFDSYRNSIHDVFICINDWRLHHSILYRILFVYDCNDQMYQGHFMRYQSQCSVENQTKMHF